MTLTEPSFTYLSTWGQFLDGQWQLRAGPAVQFTSSLEAAHTHEGLKNAFPLPTLSGGAPIDVFYSFYHLDGT